MFAKFLKLSSRKILIIDSLVIFCWSDLLTTYISTVAILMYAESAHYKNS